MTSLSRRLSGFTGFTLQPVRPLAPLLICSLGTHTNLFRFAPVLQVRAPLAYSRPVRSTGGTPGLSRVPILPFPPWLSKDLVGFTRVWSLRKIAGVYKELFYKNAGLQQIRYLESYQTSCVANHLKIG